MNQPLSAPPSLVRDLMTVGVTTCSPDASLANLARMILENGLEDIIVLEEGHALGVLGQDDLVRVYAAGNGANMTARQAMREGVPQVPPDIPLEAAAQIMRDLSVRSLFLMHHAGGIEYPAGVITYRHLIRHLAANHPDELVDLGIKASRRLPLETFREKREAARKSVARRSQPEERPD